MPCSATPGVCCSALLALLLAWNPYAAAQHGGGGGPHGMGQGAPGGGGMGPGGPGGAGFGPHDYSHPNGAPPPGSSPESAGSMGAMRGGLQVGPPGRWWDDKHFARDLKLRPDQQHRMDSIFENNKPALLGRLSVVQQEETRLEALSHTRNPDEGTLNAQIDRVWQARAELEKAKTHYLLQIRQEMDADQIARLEQLR